MSDIQTPLIVQQRRKQQRQILAMMGIEQWVQPCSNTINIADISAPTVSVSSLKDTDINTNTNTETDADHNSEPLDIRQPVMGGPEMAALLSESSPSEDSKSKTSHTDYQTNNANEANSSDTAVTALVDNVVEHTAVPIVQADSPQKDSLKTETNNESGEDELDALSVAPFDLQGGRYADWVILVDIQALNHDSQKLWHNITHALSITCETTSFPICAGMDTAELANASLAGYVFKIGRSEDIQVVALTPLADGLAHPNMITVPTLDEMLADSDLKRQLWERLSGQTQRLDATGRENSK